MAAVVSEAASVESLRHYRRTGQGINVLRHPAYVQHAGSARLCLSNNIVVESACPLDAPSFDRSVPRQLQIIVAVIAKQDYARGLGW